MSLDFETRLEQELLTAARRRSRRRSRRVPAILRRRPPALAAAVAVAALVLAAALVIALPSGDRAEPTPAAPREALPRQCDAAARRGLVRITAAPVDRRLLDAYAVLRRPQTAADRRTCAATMGIAVNPSSIRYAGEDVDGNAIYLIPAASTPDVTRAFRRRLRVGPDRNPYRTGPMLCHTIVYPRSRGSGCEAAIAGLGRYSGSTHGERSAVFFGIFADGVAATELIFEDGSTRRVPVNANVSTFELRGERPTPANSVARYRLLDADGVTLVVRGGAQARLRLMDADVRRTMRQMPERLDLERLRPLARVGQPRGR